MILGLVVVGLNLLDVGPTSWLVVGLVGISIALTLASWRIQERAVKRRRGA